MKNTLKQALLATALLMAMLLSLAGAEAITSHLLVSADPTSSRINISVISDSLFYEPFFFRGMTPEAEDYTIRMFDSSGNTLEEGKVYIYENNIYKFDSSIARIIVYRPGGEQAVLEKEVSFCNNNAICEPCYGYGCTLMENSLSCPGDCQSGGNDGCCDLANDGYCDPDCENHDKDCPGCVDNCWYSDSTISLTSCAEDEAGIICNPGQRCTGSYVYADDSGSLCCTKGKCAGGKKEETTPDEELYRVPDVISNLGELPDPEVNRSSTRFIPLIVAVIIAVAGLIFFVSWKKTQ